MSRYDGRTFGNRVPIGSLRAQHRYHIMTPYGGRFVDAAWSTFVPPPNSFHSIADL